MDRQVDEGKDKCVNGTAGGWMERQVCKWTVGGWMERHVGKWTEMCMNGKTRG